MEIMLMLVGVSITLICQGFLKLSFGLSPGPSYPPHSW